MKQVLFAALITIVISSCGSSKNYLERSDEEKALADAIKKLSKSPSDEDAKAAVPVLYANIQKNQLAKIKGYKAEKDPARWDKIIKSYQQLQDAYEAIIDNSAAFKLVNAESFSTQLLESKQMAAEEYYQAGNNQLLKGGRENAKKAYTAFKKADKFIPGYKDAQGKMEDAYEAAIVNVVINPIQDNSFFFNSSWGNYGYNYSNEYFQQTLVRELAGINTNRYPARFFTDWEARRDNIQPDWVVDLKLRNIDIPFYPSQNTYRRNASSRVEVGRDTSGNPVYQTVYATVNITRSSFTARADMDVNITDVVSGKDISYRNISDDYRWEEERATYTGDSRALSSRDWQIINNYNYSTPRKEDILNELYRKIYPQVKNNITYAVDW
jgi:hypothetical protein